METVIARTRRPDVTFSPNGRISISSVAARLLTLSPGDVINLADSQGELYIFRIPAEETFGRHRARCYSCNHGSHYLLANSVTLCRHAFRLAASDGSRRIGFNVGSPVTVDGVRCLPIIYKHPFDL